MLMQFPISLQQRFTLTILIENVIKAYIKMFNWENVITLPAECMK